VTTGVNFSRKTPAEIAATLDGTRSRGGAETIARKAKVEIV